MAKRKNNAGTVKKKQITEKNLKANRNYKDTVFRMLFSDRKNLLSLLQICFCMNTSPHTIRTCR